MATSKPNTSRAPTEKTIYWAETIVRWTRGTSANIYIEPSATNSEVVAEIHRGDMIQVRMDIKRDTWVPCRTGHVTGWLDTQHVKLIRTGTAPMSQTLTIETPKVSVDDAEQRKRKTGLIQRLIKFFK